MGQLFPSKNAKLIYSLVIFTNIETNGCSSSSLFARIEIHNRIIKRIIGSGEGKLNPWRPYK